MVVGLIPHSRITRMKAKLTANLFLLSLLFSLFIPLAQTSAQAPSGPTLTVTLPNMVLSEAMDFFAEELGVSILIDPSLAPRLVTANLRDLPVMEAFESVLKAHGMWYEVNATGRVYLIKQADIPFSGRITERVLVNFIELSTVENIVQRYIQTSGSYIKDERTNSFVVTDTPNRVADLRQILKTLDVPSPQVMIEVEIAAVDRSETNKLGVQWDFLGQIDADSPIGGGTATTKFGKDGALSISLGKFAANVGPKNLVATLEALERDGYADILASPRLLTINRQAAKINITEHTATGTRVVQSTSALGQTVTEPIYNDVGVTLSVTPAVAGDSLVVMIINPTVSTARRSPFFPAIAVDTQERSTETTVMARHNQTIVIGGLHQTNLTEEITRIPLLGHIPILGYLFSQRSKDIRKTELMIFITPRIITPENLQTLRKSLNPPPDPRH